MDYSNTNIKWLKTKGINAKLFRKHYTESFTFPLNNNYEIDVLFYGAITEERRQIREQLQERFPDSKICFYVNLWGKDRDEIIAKSKIVLNIHGYPSNIFESSRVCHLLSNKIFVISETSVDDEDYPEFDDGLIRCNREDIIETVAKYLELPDKRLEISNAGYQAVKNFKPMIPDF